MPEAYNLKVTRYTYAEKADDATNKVSQRNRDDINQIRISGSK